MRPRQSCWSVLLFASACAAGADPLTDATTEPDIGEPHDAGAEDGSTSPMDATDQPEDAAEEAAASADSALPGGDASPRDAGTPDAARDAAPDAAQDASGVRSDAAADTAVPPAGADAGDASADAAEAAAPNPQPKPFAYTPSNVGIDSIDFAGTPAATLNCGTTEIDTGGMITLRNWCGTAPVPMVRTQAGGGEVAVIALRGLTLQENATLRVFGARPLVVLVAGDVSVRGSVDASARNGNAGPGGNLMCSNSTGTDGSGDSGADGAGGGGGGFGTRGGNGGSSSGDSMPGSGGAARGNAELTPLLGGCAGGRGGGCVGTAGAGGGALQISASAALLVSGSVRANGGNGADGCGNDAGGAGAGSGGGVLLEGQNVTVTRTMISVAGGRGGAGQAGGNGGAGATAANGVGENGENGGASGGGGGGGGHGRLRLRGIAMCTGC
jgi:hypothetical protein